MTALEPVTPTPEQVRADVDQTLHRLRSGAALSTRERLGLAELLMNVRSAHRVAQRPEHVSASSRSGLWRNLQAVFTREFTTNPPTEDGTP